MKRVNISDFTGGWFIGDFEPTLLKTTSFEVAVKSFSPGDTEPLHYQLTSTEYTVVVSGRCRLGGFVLEQGDVLEIPPNESAAFEALDHVVLVAIKTPSLPDDKRLGDSR